MSQLITLAFALTLSLTAVAGDISLKGFNERFTLVKNNEGRVIAIKLNKAVKKFTIRPYIDQIKADLMHEQQAIVGLSATDREAEIDQLLEDVGASLYGDDQNSQEAQALKDSLLNVGNIKVENAFAELNQGTFWKEFEQRLQNAFNYIDPTILTYHDDPRFFYKQNVTYKVVQWALQEAQKRFSNLPILGIASFVIVRVHDMMLEQRSFHHNMLLHYFENVSETQLGMTKEEVDRAVSSIYEYRIEPTNILESNHANADWLNYGMNNFYRSVRAGNDIVREWQLDLQRFSAVKKIDFAFAQVWENGVRRIYHLHNKSNMFSSKPALAYDYAKPNRVKRNRALLNIAGLALGFIQLPQWLRVSADNFIKSFYVEQVRMEGALVGYFESTGDTAMVNKIYDQRANFYIVR